jgi:hypothetical protein
VTFFEVLTNMRRILLLAYIFALILIPCFAQTKKMQTNPDAKILITIEREGCHGYCAVYSAQIYTDGTVVYQGKRFVEVKGKRQYKIPQEKVKELIEEFQKINYFSLKDIYDNGFVGAQVTTTSISLNDTQKKVINIAAPTEVYQLEDKIDEIAGLTKFVERNEWEVRFIRFYTALNTIPEAKGFITNYGTAKNVSKREADIRKFFKVWKFNPNKITFKNHIRKSEIKTDLRIVNGEKTLDF